MVPWHLAGAEPGNWQGGVSGVGAFGGTFLYIRNARAQGSWSCTHIIIRIWALIMALNPSRSCYIFIYNMCAVCVRGFCMCTKLTPEVAIMAHEGAAIYKLNWSESLIMNHLGWGRPTVVRLWVRLVGCRWRRAWPKVEATSPSPRIGIRHLAQIDQSCGVYLVGEFNTI